MGTRHWEGGSPVNGMPPSPRAALPSAASNGRAENVQQLLEEGVGIEERDQHGRSALHEAARRGRRTIVHLLLDKSADVAVKTMAGDTPLRLAAQRLDREIVQSDSARVDARKLAGLQPMLRRAFSGMVAGVEDKVVVLLRAAKRRAECEAFAMGHHQRLGAQSLIQGLDADVVRLILDQMAPPPTHRFREYWLNSYLSSYWRRKWE